MATIGHRAYMRWVEMAAIVPARVQALGGDGHPRPQAELAAMSRQG